MSIKRGDGPKSSRKKNNAAEDWADSFNPNRMMNNAQRILTSAVNVLEEEIAAGILAAKKLEKRVIDVEEVRSDPQELMSRIRRDTHEAIDIFLDALTALTHQMGILSNGIKKEGGASSSTPTNPKNENVVPVIHSETTVKPGDIAYLYISMSNDDRQNTIDVSFLKADLTAGPKSKITARNMVFNPSSIELKHGDQKEIEIKVQVPKTCKPGQYQALLTDPNNGDIRTVIVIDVA